MGRGVVYRGNRTVNRGVIYRWYRSLAGAVKDRGYMALHRAVIAQRHRDLTAPLGDDDYRS